MSTSDTATTLPLPPIQGQVLKLTLPSTILEREKRIQVYLPPDYDEQTQRDYPVLYMHLGQRVFDPPKPGQESWQVHRTLERLLADGLIEPVVVVAIAADRATVMEDYNHYRGIIPETGCRGLLQEAFILQELKPFIEANFRVKTDPANNAMLGISNSALFTYNLAAQNPGVFGKIALLSPVVEARYTHEKLYQQPLPPQQFTIWLDVGEGEGADTPPVRELADFIVKQGYKSGQDLFYYREPNAGHLDPHWRQRMACPLLLFFGIIGKPVSVTLHGYATMGIGQQPLALNPVITYDSGFCMSSLDSQYTSSDPAILAIQSNGYLTGGAEGEADITITINPLQQTRRFRVVPALHDPVHITLNVHVPSDTPEVETLYLYTLPIPRLSLILYQGHYTLPRGFCVIGWLACLINTREAQHDGTPAPLRCLRADADTELNYTVECWQKY